MKTNKKYGSGEAKLLRTWIGAGSGIEIPKGPKWVDDGLCG